ncbi:MAG TPA: hypothetical protein VN397_05145 [Candidatus Methylomirabilis sp.]|nr:hypothetical protein [Candidatus Methylomirabilis sp.]
MLTLLFLAIVLYGVIFTLLWGWSVIHAILTPHVEWGRRGLWTAVIVINPVSAMWYWYVWKRWAFWVLFTPALAFMATLPFALEQMIRAFTARDVADRFVTIGTLFLTNVLGAIPLPVLLPLAAFPFVLRLAALAHLGGNRDLTAADRNDQAIAFALPLFGFGAAMAYTFKWRRVWAAFGIAWFALAAGTVWSFVRYLG